MGFLVFPAAGASTTPEPHPNQFRGVMKALVETLIVWLDANRNDANAYSLLRALATETMKRIDSDDPVQREFDAQGLVAACRRSEADDFEAAKRWIDKAKLEAFVESRTAPIESFFAARGHPQAIRVEKRSSSGRHRAQWFLQAYDLPEAGVIVGAPDEPALARDAGSQTVVYDYTPPGDVRPARWARLMLGSGSLIVQSARGWLWGGRGRRHPNWPPGSSSRYTTPHISNSHSVCACPWPRSTRSCAWLAAHSESLCSALDLSYGSDRPDYSSSRNKRRSTLPAPVAGSASTNLTLRGAL